MVTHIGSRPAGEEERTMMTNNLDGPPDLDPDDNEPEPDLDISLAVLLETLAAPFSYRNDEERI